MDYDLYAQTMKALSDPNRVQILDILSCDSLIARDILKHFNFTQPTLSHHIKVLRDINLVIMEKEGTWHRYSINKKTVEQLMAFTQNLFLDSERCICYTKNSNQV